jgi:hypothetical protein
MENRQGRGERSDLNARQGRESHGSRSSLFKRAAVPWRTTTTGPRNESREDDREPVLTAGQGLTHVRLHLQSVWAGEEMFMDDVARVERPS